MKSCYSVSISLLVKDLVNFWTVGNLGTLPKDIGIILNEKVDRFNHVFFKILSSSVKQSPLIARLARPLSVPPRHRIW